MQRWYVWISKSITFISNSYNLILPMHKRCTSNKRTLKFVSIFPIKRFKCARACDVLMVKILNKCIVTILVYSLCYTQTAQYVHTSVYCLFLLNRNSNFQIILFPDWAKNRLDTKTTLFGL